MVMKKRIAVFILSMLLTLTSTVSCAENRSEDKVNNGEAKDSDSKVNSEKPETEEDVNYTEKFRSDYKDIDFAGYSFRILDRASGDWKTFDVYAEEMNGETINDAVYSRNTILEETIGIKIVECQTESVTADLKKSVTSSSDDYDTGTDGLENLATLVQQHYLINMRDISSLGLENMWWDQAMYEQLSVANGTYFMTGDISVMDNYGTWCYLFNKQLVKDLNLENPYELVDSGKWTLDKHNEMAEKAQNDTDGDGRWTDSDIYGFVTEPYNTLALWTCTGNRIAQKDENDLPYYTYKSEESISALMDIIDTQYSSFTNVGTKSTVVNGGSFQPNTRENQFASGNALFYFAGFRNVTLFRESEVDFGIIPAPKYSEEQSSYYSSYSPGNCTAYAIPVTSGNPEQTGQILECMAELGLYILTPAYYEKTLIGKSTRDSESEPMIELIFRTRNFDIGIIFNIGNVYNTIWNMTTSGEVASKLEKLEKPSAKLLDKFLNEFSE